MLARFIPRGFGITSIDIENLLGVDNLDEFINNTFF